MPNVLILMIYYLILEGENRRYTLEQIEREEFNSDQNISDNEVGHFTYLKSFYFFGCRVCVFFLLKSQTAKLED